MTRESYAQQVKGKKGVRRIFNAAGYSKDGFCSAYRYESAFRIVQSIGKLRKQQDRVAEFKQELARIRLEYKAKRNFIKLLSVLG